jgi:hypothetical protein
MEGESANLIPSGVRTHSSEKFTCVARKGKSHNAGSFVVVNIKTEKTFSHRFYSSNIV